MNGCILLIPFLCIRFILLSRYNKQAVHRAAHFPSMKGNERYAYWIYQVSNVTIFIYICFLRITYTNILLFYVGVFVYLIGLLLCAITIKNFAYPEISGLNKNGLYRFSRNPMYVSYFVLFIGCCLLTHSLVLCGNVFVFQISAHWIILAEERWCIENFGTFYTQYMKEVRRYI